METCYLLIAPVGPRSPQQNPVINRSQHWQIISSVSYRDGEEGAQG